MMAKWKKETLTKHQAAILRRARESGGIIYDAGNGTYSFRDGKAVGKKSVESLIARKYLNPKDAGLFGDTPQIYGVGVL